MLPVTDAAPSLAMTGLGRTFARNDLTRTPVLERFVGGLAALMAQEGYEGTATPGPDTNVVLHVALDPNTGKIRQLLGPAELRQVQVWLDTGQLSVKKSVVTQRSR